MLKNIRFCVLGNVYAPKRDRFMPSPVKPNPSTADVIATTARIMGLSGVELIHPQQVTDDNLAAVKAALQQHGLACASVAASVSSRWEYEGGSLTADDPAVRAQAVQTAKNTLDLAAALGAQRINLWLGRDGFDYAFQIDYPEMWRRLADGLTEICHYRPELKVGVEYKSYEPRKRLLVANAGRVLLLRQETGCKNLGGLLDTGHALYGQENLGEVVALLAGHDALVHVHLNDNYRLADDDLIVGTVGFLEFIEMFYWMDRVGYDGWISLDPHTSLEDPVRAVEEGLKFTHGLIGLIENIGPERFTRAIATRQVTEALALINGYLFGGRKKR